MTVNKDQQIPAFEMHDLLESYEFIRRMPKAHLECRKHLALDKIGKSLFEDPETMLQQLVEVATELCGADGSGVSLEEPDGLGGMQFRWVAIAGSFEKYRHGVMPRNASPCGVCIDRGRPQSYTVSQLFFDLAGITAAPILDGMLIPWASDSARGTIWAVSHSSKTAFDQSDYSILRSLADMVTIAIRHHSAIPVLNANALGRH